MTDSVTGGLLKRGAPRTLLDLPAEMVLRIFEHCDLVSLAHLSATCRAMRYQVHDIFTSRMEAQAKKYPEIKQSLDRLGWKKKHDSWDCKCFKMMAGPFFTWTELEEQRSFAVSYVSNPSRTSTTVAGKTFFITDSREVRYAEMAPRCGTGSGPGQNSLQTLASFNHEVVCVLLASYDNVLAVVLEKRDTYSVCIFNARTLARVCEVNLCDDIDDVDNVALTRDTMVVLLSSFDHIQIEDENKIQIWRMNTENPEEDGISLLHTITYHHNAWVGSQTLSINDRFIAVILYDIVKVLGRHGETPLVRQLEFENKTVKAMAMQGGRGDHLALAFLSVNANNVSELTVKVYSASQGNLIIQKEVGLFPRRFAPLFMKWFGDHLTVGLQQDNTVSLFSWQPGLDSFLTAPCGVPVLRRSPRGNRGGTALWTAYCLHVDFQGITTALENGSEKVLFKTWKSTS